MYLRHDRRFHRLSKDAKDKNFEKRTDRHPPDFEMAPAPNQVRLRLPSPSASTKENFGDDDDESKGGLIEHVVEFGFKVLEK